MFFFDLTFSGWVGYGGGGDFNFMRKKNSLENDIL